MSGLARIGDMGVGVCCCHSKPKCRHKIGFIILGSGDSQANSMGLARCGDVVLATCGHPGVIVSGSSQTTTNSSGQAFIGSSFVGCFTGVIVSGSSDVTTG
jgi:uncharacterized Zn-binding protein involved in type VI secretion